MPATKIHDAVTVVLLHEDHIFMLRRQQALKAFPGYWAFPGGKVDQSDQTDTEHLGPWGSAFDNNLMHALARELHEELGLSLNQLFDDGDVIDLKKIGQALTPPIIPVRFNTHFFRLRLKRRPNVQLALSESAECDWAPAEDWLRQFRDGQMLLAPPTLGSLRLFESGADTASGNAQMEDVDRDGVPLIESINGVRQFYVRSNTLPPAAHTSAFLLGDMDRHRVLVDPSPCDETELERLLSATQAFGFQEIFLTHHHPDHYQFADQIARSLNVPIGLSADSEQRIRAERGDDFFDGITIKHYAEGDVLTYWLGRPIKILSVPGHDEGQLALMPQDKSWCIVSDLFQGIGTVVIAKPEGHMGRYFQSLQRIIDLNPRAVYPSHGMGQGGTNRLQETLRHRQMREQQVEQLYASGQSIDQMLSQIYQGVDARLLPLARMNIESHLDKLREEGRVSA